MEEEQKRPDSEQESAGTSEQEAASAPGEPVDVWAVLRYCMLMLHSQAWQYMGLVPDPVTGETKKDLEQAKAAIDTVAHIAGQLETRAEGQELRDLRSMVSDLRLNFVQQQGRGED